MCCKFNTQTRSPFFFVPQLKGEKKAKNNKKNPLSTSNTNNHSVSDKHPFTQPLIHAGTVELLKACGVCLFGFLLKEEEEK